MVSQAYIFDTILHETGLIYKCRQLHTVLEDLSILKRVKDILYSLIYYFAAGTICTCIATCKGKNTAQLLQVLCIKNVISFKRLQKFQAVDEDHRNGLKTNIQCSTKHLQAIITLVNDLIGPYIKQDKWRILKENYM